MISLSFLGELWCFWSNLSCFLHLCLLTPFPPFCLSRAFFPIPTPLFESISNFQVLKTECPSVPIMRLPNTHPCLVFLVAFPHHHSLHFYLVSLLSIHFVQHLEFIICLLHEMHHAKDVNFSTSSGKKSLHGFPVSQ